MAETRMKMAAIDPVWQRIGEEAVEAIRSEPLLGGLVHSSLLHHASMERALAYRFSLKLASGEMSEQILREIADEAYATDPDLGQAARADLVAVYDRDPACHRFLQPILYFKGYQAVQAYRVGHWLWQAGRIDLAYFVQMRVSEVFGVDIHPAAKIGRGIMIDHAHWKRGADRGRCKGSGQYREWLLQPHRRRFRCLAGRAALLDRRGRSRPCRGRGGLRAAFGDDGSSDPRAFRRVDPSAPAEGRTIRPAWRQGFQGFR